MYTDFLLDRARMMQALRDLDAHLHQEDIAVLLLMGESAVLAGYPFHPHITAVDACCSCPGFQEAVRRTAADCRLPEHWLGSESISDGSYASAMMERSVCWLRLSRMEIRTIRGPELIAARLMASDTSCGSLMDVLGILEEAQEAGRPILPEQVEEAVQALYHGWHEMPSGAFPFLQHAIDGDSCSGIFQALMQAEQRIALLSAVPREEELPCLEYSCSEEIAAIAEQRCRDWSLLSGRPPYIRQIR